MTPRYNYFLTWGLAALFTFSVSGIADAAKPASRRQKFFFFAAIYEPAGKNGSAARVVVDKVQYRDGKEGVLESQFKNDIQSQYQTLHHTWVIHVIPTTTTAVVYTFTMDNGRVKGVAVAEGANQAAAEQNMQTQADQFGRKDVRIVKGWPTAADLQDGESTTTWDMGSTADTTASTDPKPKKRGLFDWLRSSSEKKAKPAASTPQETAQAPQVATGQVVQGNNVPPQVAQTGASQAPIPVSQEGAANFAQMIGKYAFVSGTTSMPFGSTPMQPVECEVSGTAAKPELMLSAQVYDLRQTGPGTYSFSDSDENQSTQGTCSFQNGVLQVQQNITMFAAGTTITNSSTHQKR